MRRPTSGTRDVMRWNSPDGWVISASPAHLALVCEADLIAVQGIRVRRDTALPGEYALAGLLRCGSCGRAMESCWSHGRAYRCRHGQTSSAAPWPDRLCNAYMREDHVLSHLPVLWIRLTTTSVDEAEMGAATAPEAVGRLSARGVGLVYNPADRTFTASTPSRERIAIG